MARTFDGVDDIISATVTAADSGNWTLFAWVRPASSGEGNVGRVFRVDAAAATLIQTLRCGLSGSDIILVGSQTHATVAATTTGSTPIAANTWHAVFATYRASDSKVRIYSGTISASVAEHSYSAQTAGTGARSTSGTAMLVGNSASAAQTFDGRIARAGFDAREWSLDEMEQFRLGQPAVQTGTLRFFLPLDSPTAAQAEDLSGNGANGTVTGATVSEGPPIPYNWGQFDPQIAPLVVNGTASPAAVATTISVPTAALAGSTAPSVVATSVATLAPTLSGSTSPSPVAATIAALQPAPVASVSPSPFSTVTAFPQSRLDGSAGPTPVATVVALPTPVLQAGQTVAPSPITLVSALLQPEGHGSVGASPFATLVTLPPAEAQAGQSTFPSPIALLAAFLAPGLTSSAGPQPAQLTTAFGTPSLAGSVGTSLLAVLVALPTPATTGEMVATPATIAVLTAFNSPALSGSVGCQVVVLIVALPQVSAFSLFPIRYFDGGLSVGHHDATATSGHHDNTSTSGHHDGTRTGTKRDGTLVGAGHREGVGP